MPPRHIVRTKLRRFMIISIGMPGLRARARFVHQRQSSHPPAAHAADRPRGRRRRPAGCADRFVATPFDRAQGARAWSRAAARNRARELGAVQQRIRIGPFLGHVAESFWRLRGPQRMSQLPQQRHRRVAHLGRLERPQHRNQPVLRRAKLPRGVAPGFGEIDQGDGHRA